METKKLISKLQDNHVKFNQTVENYEENGEEDFQTWLIGEIEKCGIKWEWQSKMGTYTKKEEEMDIEWLMGYGISEEDAKRFVTNLLEAERK